MERLRGGRSRGKERIIKRLGVKKKIMGKLENKGLPKVVRKETKWKKYNLEGKIEKNKVKTNV